MQAATIFGRELLTAARRGGTYRRRCQFAVALLAALALLFGWAFYWRGGELSIREMAFFSNLVFGLAASCQVFLTIWLVPSCVAAAIAEEKERRTLSGVLTTRLSSAEIVLGKLAAGLVQYMGCLLAGVPIMFLLPLLGGIDPQWVLLVYAATASTAFSLAGLSILVSTEARRGGRAVAETIGLASAWYGLPIYGHFLLPRAIRWLVPWIYPVNQWVLASTPAGVLITAVRAGLGSMFFESILWMMGLQLFVGTLMIAWAVARFRKACRNQEGEGGYVASRSIGRLPWLCLPRSRRRPPCGENPVLWKERYTARPRGLAQILGAVVALGLVALIGYGTYVLALPAYLEWVGQGPGVVTSDIQRTKFNLFLRHVTSWAEFFILLIAAGVAAEGVSAERARQTWDGLITTALEGRAILGAKMFGAAWKVRWGLILLGVLWSVGLLTGALHPLGFAAASLLLGVATWFMVALGTFMSLVSRDSAQASNRTLIPVLLLSGSFLIGPLAAGHATVVMGSASVPLVNWLALMSYHDIAAIMSGQGTLPELAEIGLATGDGPLWVLATLVLGTAGTAAAAAAFTRTAVTRFDRAVGRPVRRPEERGRRETPPIPESGLRRREHVRVG